MSEQTTRTQGDERLAVSNALVALYRERYGRGPTRAKTYAFDDILICVLHGGTLAIERTLLGAGQAELVGDVRRAFQHTESQQFIDSVEAATGRKVQTFLSQHEPDK